jgi:hypothetical protein
LRQGRQLLSVVSWRASALPAERHTVAQGDIETYYEDGTWKNKREGNDRAFGTGRTKEGAVAQGREAAQKDGVEHVI